MIHNNEMLLLMGVCFLSPLETPGLGRWHVQWTYYILSENLGSGNLTLSHTFGKLHFT